MRHKTEMLMRAIFLLVGLVSLALVPVQSAGANGYLQIDLTPTWATGIISDGVGPSDIVVTDLNQDGVTDIVACSNGSAYVLNKITEDYYDTTQYSERFRCSKVAAGDRNNDGIQEVYIGTSNSKVFILNGDDFRKIGELSLPDNKDSPSVKGVAVADVDKDGSKELVVVRADATFVYDANTLMLEWQADNKGGNRLGIGDIDGDSEPEIVVNGNPAHILNAILKTEEWAYSGGFGIDMALGDVDGDDIAEIAYIKGGGYVDSDIYVFEADTFSTKWHTGPIFGLNVIAVADTDGDDVDEVLTGAGQWGSVTGYRGNDGTRLWSIPNPEHGVFGIGVGDTDNDGVNEVIWGAGLSSTGKDVLVIGDWERESVEWSSDDLDGPLYVAAGDIDNDGQVEIVMASRSTASGYKGGTIRVYDGATHRLEWSTVVHNSYYALYQVAVGQLDSDPALEIVVGGDNWYDTRLQVYDGITHAMEWKSPVLANGAPADLFVMNLDADPVDEIVVGLSNRHVQIFNGATPVIQWDSGKLDGRIKDLAIGDLDGDSALDLAVLTNQSVYVFEVGTGDQKLHRAIKDGTRLAIVDGDTGNPGQLLIVTSTYNLDARLQAWDGADYALLWQRLLGNVFVNDIFSGDLDGDGYDEFVVMGHVDSNAQYNWGDQSLLFVGSQITPSYWTEYQSNSYWGSINGVVFADVDNDNQGELVFGSNSLILVNEISASPLAIRTTYLPIVMRSQR